jgi:hypothetical protein
MSLTSYREPGLSREAWAIWRDISPPGAELPGSDLTRSAPQDPAAAICAARCQDCGYLASAQGHRIECEAA